jgi:hypothetical protein
MSKAIPIELPRHLYVPEDGVSIDLRKVCKVEAATALTLFMSYQVPRGAQAIFIGYGLFNDGLFSTDTEFLPRVDGGRIFPYHGDPSNNYKMSLGLGPDLSNSNLINCYLTLNEGQVLTWYVANAATVDTVMGIRMVGYFSSASRREAPRFGG